MIEGAGVELHVKVSGDGPAVLFVHGLAADGASFEPLCETLAPRARTIVYDRRGYGSSGAPTPYTATTVSEQAEDAAALLRGLHVGGALAVGDGFGALVVLDLVKRHRSLITAAIVCNPPLFAFVPAATEILSAARARIEQTLRDGGPQAAVEDWLAGRVTGSALQRARESHRGFLADFAGLASWPITRAELRGFALAIIALTGPDSPAHIQAAADALCELVPAARRRRDGDLLAAIDELLG